MNSIAQQLLECPECRQEFDTQEHGKRYPTSCRWCAHTVCATCVKETPKPKQAKIYGVPCRKCGKGGAFHGSTPVVHKLSCQLLLKIQLLQNQWNQEQKTSTCSTTEDSSSSAVMPPPTLRSVSDSEEPQSNPLEKTKPSRAFPSVIHPPEEPFSNGTDVYDGKRWGTIESSAKGEPLYAIQYGDGDPQWVKYQEMFQLVLAADEKLNNGSQPLFAGDPSDEEDFLGRHVFREFSRMGWYWGKVVECSVERQYTLVFAGKRESGVSQDQVRHWVDAAQRQKSESPKTKPAKRKASNNSDYCTSTVQQKKPKTIHKEHALAPCGEEVTIDEDFKLPVDARGMGWSGFDLCISDSTLPTKFRHIVALMDFLFPVAKGENTFYYTLWERAMEKGYKGGAEVRDVLHRLKKSNESALSWHERATPYVPQTKKDLAGFIDLLLSLDMSPKVALKCRDQNVPSSPTSKPRNIKNNLVLSDCLTLPSSLQGKGWKGFHTAFLGDNLPEKFGQIFEVMDFFFPVAVGQKSFVDALYDCSTAESMRPGDSIRKILRSLRIKDPFLPGLQWHSRSSAYVPKTKKDLADFVQLLMSLPKAPILASRR